jgi:hypothetical protein
LGAWGGGWRGAPKVPADNTHASCTPTVVVVVVVYSGKAG